MIALTIIGIIIAIIIFIAIGFSIWSSAKERYDYNIYSLGNILRAFLGSASLSIGFIVQYILLNGESETNAIVLYTLGVLIYLWNLILMFKNTNFIIAIIGFIYQIILALTIVKIISTLFSND